MWLGGRGGKGRGYVKYSFTVADFAKLFGKSEETIRRWIRNKKLRPRSLFGILDLYNERRAAGKIKG